MEKSVIKYLAEFSARLDEVYGDSINLDKLFADADNEKLNITDDFSWVADFEKTLGFIQRILGKEHLHVKYLKEVVRAQAASRLDAEGFALTLRDTRLWKDSENGPRPESVHMTVFEDEYAIYENRFIATLIDQMIRYLSVALTEMATAMGNLREYFGSGLTTAGAIRTAEELGRASQEADDERILTSNDNPIVDIYERVEKLLKKAGKFRNSRLYKACLGKPLTGVVQPTNILTKDPVYRECFLFHKRFSKLNYHIEHADGSMFDNGVLRLLYAMYRSGYRVVGDEFFNRYSEEGMVKNKITLEKDGIIIEVDVREKDELSLTIAMSGASADVDDAKKEQRRYISWVALKFADCDLESVPYYANSYRAQRAVDGYDDAYVIAYSRNPMEHEGVLNFINKGDLACRAAEDFVRSLTMQFVATHKVFGKRCPVCGTKCLDGDQSVLTCVGCGSKWSLVKDGEIEKVWVKRLRR